MKVVTLHRKKLGGGLLGHPIPKRTGSRAWESLEMICRRAKVLWKEWGREEGQM